MSGIKIGNLDVSVFKVGSADCTIYLGDILLYPQGSHRTRVIRSSNYCSNANMYYDMLYQESDDYGETWTTTATTQVLVENDSYDCGYRTRTTSGSPYCSGTTGYDKYVDVYTEESRDSGTTWATAFTTPTLVEKNSEDCGYTPPNYLTFVALENSTFTFNGGSKNTSIQYSVNNGNTWVTLTSGVASPTISSGSKIMWKLVSKNDYNVGSFAASGNFEAKGNIMSLIYGDDFDGKTSFGDNKNVAALFSGNTYIVSAENLELPATTLNRNCYSSMFRDCTSLTKAPSVLPSTSIPQQGYEHMFRGCSSLTAVSENLLASVTNFGYDCCYCMFYGTSLITAPKLPSTTLGERCYRYMFANCTSLTTAPELPATTLANDCYVGMFSNCTSLTTAPELSATSLVGGDWGCYYRMFKGCSNLTSITCLATNLNYTRDWVNGVAANGTFTKSASMTSWTTGNDGIPSGWTVQDYSS